MTQPEQLGRRMRARYAPRGASAELERTLLLAGDEEVLLQGAMRLRESGRLPRPVVVRLTQHRLSLLAHYAFQPDRAWDLPRGSVRDVRLVGRAVRVAGTVESGPVELGLSAWSGRAAPDRPLRDVEAVADALLSWLGPSGRS